MVLIEDAHQYIDTKIEGLFQLAAAESRTDRYGRPYTYLVLKDHGGVLPAYAWTVSDKERASLECGVPVHAILTVRRLGNRLIGHVSRLSQKDLSVFNPIQFLPRRTLPRPELAARLQGFIEHCRPVPLQQFLVTAFSDLAFSRSFLSLPASQAHHHAYPGGLAEHSLEVAETIRAILTHEEPSMVDLTSVAGLLHDVGKIRLIKESGARTQAGFILRHDALTLELLAPALAGLDACWPDGSTALRYLLSWQFSGQSRRPLLPAALALQFADRYSSAHGARERAFADAPDWKRFARLETPGPISRFWRPNTTRAMLTQSTSLQQLIHEEVL